jgi:hypothetical protein
LIVNGLDRPVLPVGVSEPHMSFFSALLGKLAPAPAEKVPEPVEYNGFTIRPAPFKSEGQFQTAGTIEREVDGVRKEHRFVRADGFASFEDAVTFTIAKARQMIDLQGDRMFG